MDSAGAGAELTGRMQALREASFNLNPNPMAITRLEDGLVVDVNESFLRFGRCSRQEVIGLTASALGIWATSDVRDTVTRLLHEQGKVRDFQAEMLTGSDEVRTVMFSNDIIRVDDKAYLLSVIEDICEHKQAEEKLVQAGRNFLTFFNSVDDFLFVLDEAGKILRFNGTVLRRLGYTAAELAGMSLTDILLADRRDEAGRTIAAMLEGKANFCPVPLVDRNGVQIEVETRLSRGQWDGKPAIFGVSKDVTEFRQSEEVLLMQRNLAIELGAATGLKEALHVLMDKTLQIPGVDCGGVYLVNPGTGGLDLVAHTGLSPDFIVNASHYAPDSGKVHMVRAGTPVYISYGEMGIGETRETMCREGLRALAVVPVMYEGQAVAALNLSSHTLEDFPPQVRAVIETIAAQIGGLLLRARAEEDLQESRDNLQTLFDTVDDFLFILDGVGNMLVVNPVVLRRLKYTEAELEGQHVLMVHPPERRDEAQRIIGEMLSGTADFCPVPLLTKDGSRIPVETRVTQGVWRGRPAIFGISRDVSERQRATEALQKARDELELRFVERTAELAQSRTRWQKVAGDTIAAMASLLEARDPYTTSHQNRVTVLAMAMAGAMGMDEEFIDGLRLAATIHDIGKLSIPIEILNRQGKLSEAEFTIVKTHTEIGYGIIRKIEFPRPVAQIVYQHHELVDGSGYPQKLKGQEILLEARILAVADVVEAMSSDRPYRPGLGLTAAFEEIIRNRGKKYDADAVDICLKLFNDRGFEFGE